MKITLRKAAALQSSINDFIKEIPIPLVAVINESQNPENVINDSRSKALANHAKQNALLNALYEIRESIGLANASSGITSLLTKSAHIDKRIAALSVFKDASPAEDMSVVNSKIIKMKTSTSDSLYARDSISSGIFTSEQLDGFRTEILKLRKEKQSLNDKILEANVKTEIELSDSTVLLLAKEMLI